MQITNMIRIYKNFNLLANFFFCNILIIKNLNHAIHSIIHWIQVSTREQKNLSRPDYLTNRFSTIQSRHKNKYCTYTWKYFYITAYIFYIDSSSNLTRYPAVWKYVSRFVEYYWDYRPGYFDNKRRRSNLLHETRVESVSLADKFSRCSSSYTSV